MKKNKNGKRPPILVKYTHADDRAEIDCKILSYSDEDLTHHSYSNKVMEGWDELLMRYGHRTPVIIAALGYAISDSETDEIVEAYYDELSKEFENDENILDPLE